MIGSAAPLLSPRGVLVALCAAALLGWPMLATGGYLIFSDTSSYIRGGEIIWRIMADFLSDAFASGSAGPGASGGAGDGVASTDLVNREGQARVMRSFVYSLYTLATGAAWWPGGFALLQAAATLWMLFALISPEAAQRPLALTLAFLYLAVFTTLPWFASYLMPDLLAATVVIYGCVLVRRFDELGPVQRLALGAIAAFAVIAHYGHVPLAAGLFAAVLLWRLLQRRLTLAVVLAAVLPVAFAPLANVGASSVALDKPSATPLRLPILLARSIEDGPARWYLQDVCPEADLTFCEVFGDRVPRNIPQFLWEEGGIDDMTPEQLGGIRDEEITILMRAFREYPVAQTTSLFGNAAEQLVEVGLAGVIPAERTADGGFQRQDEGSRGWAVKSAFQPVILIGTWAGAVAVVALLLSGRLKLRDVELAGVVVAGILLNAAIFGGLSAPAERYQSRVIWLIPAIAALFLTEQRWASLNGAWARR